MKNIVGLDLGTNSIGWAVVNEVSMTMEVNNWLRYKLQEVASYLWMQL